MLPSKHTISQKPYSQQYGTIADGKLVFTQLRISREHHIYGITNWDDGSRRIEGILCVYACESIMCMNSPPITTQISCRSAPSSYGPARLSICSPRSLNIFGCCGGTANGVIVVDVDVDDGDDDRMPKCKRCVWNGKTGGETGNAVVAVIEMSQSHIHTHTQRTFCM